MSELENCCGTTCDKVKLKREIDELKSQANELSGALSKTPQQCLQDVMLESTLIGFINGWNESRNDHNSERGISFNEINKMMNKYTEKFKKMKCEPCVKCGTTVLVDEDYEPEGCCNGFECGCMGQQTNPIFCRECWREMHK